MTEPSQARPLPDPAEPTLAPFWEATARHVLAIRRCRACGRAQWPPKPRCAGCAGSDFEWVEVEPHGVLYTHFTAMRSFHPAFEAPYLVGLVELESGVRMIGGLVGVDQPRVGLELEVEFSDTRGGPTLVNWKPREGG